MPKIKKDSEIVVSPELAEEFWTIKHIAVLLHRSEKSTSEYIVCQPGFPPAFRLTTSRGNRSRPLWRSEEVRQWIEKFRGRS